MQWLLENGHSKFDFDDEMDFWEMQEREGTGLSVKGTSITGFDESQSIQKTLRKPDEQLKEFKDAGKVKLRKFLDDIKTTDTKLNGRCNPETIILKVS